MITNFEELTKELNPKEKELLTGLISILQLHIDKPIKSPFIERELGISGVRVRKLINYTRVHHILPLIGTSQGYFLSWDVEQIEKQIKSLHERANSIDDCAYGLDWFLLNPQPQLKLL